MCRLSLNAMLALDADGAPCRPPWHRVLALRERHGAAGPPDAPPLARYDFAAGEYFADGAARGLADMVQSVDNGWWDPSYAPDPADVSAAGWAAQPGNSAYLLPSELAKAGWWDGETREFVATLEYDFTLGGETSGDGYLPWLALQSAEGLGFTYLETEYLAYCGFGAGHFGDGTFYAETYFYTYDYSDGSVTDERVSTEAAPTSPVKIAARFTGEDLAFCVNGGAILSTPISRGDLFPAFDMPFLANAVVGDAGANLRLVAFHSADADLHALSAS